MTSMRGFAHRRWSAAAVLAMLAWSPRAPCEGSAQLGSEALLTDEASGQTQLSVDVLPGDGFLNIAARAAGGPVDVRVTTPGGATTAHTLDNGSGLLAPGPLPASIPDPLRIDVSAEAGTYLVQFLEPVVYPFDISISNNDTDAIDPAAAPSGGGRVHTTRWHLTGELPMTEGLVVDYAFFARVPTSSSAEDLYRLDLEGIAGGALCIVANQLGLPGGLLRSSQPLAAVNAETGGSAAALDYCDDLEQYPLYLNPPNGALPAPSAPTVELAPLSGCGLVFTGSGETFEFTSDAPGTYELIIDVDGDGFVAGSTSNDAVLGGIAAVGENDVLWGGRDRSGAFLAASSTGYQAQLSVRVGEFHAPAIDVEATDPGVRIARLAASDFSESATTMFWDDTQVLEDHTNNLPDPVVALPAGVASDSAGHDWGDATTGNDGVGNDAFIDTWVIGRETIATLQFVVANAADDADADGLDNTRECAIGSFYDNDDSDGDGLLDGAEGSATDPLPNSDADTAPDVLDADDDDDGVLTSDEAPDDDGDGFPNDARDTDGDGTPDYLDDDDDGDGVLTIQEAADDTDGDSIVNHLDADDDGDSIPTRDEDLDGNGTYDEDTDGDSTPNYLDADDDGDSIPTAVEIAQAGANPDFDGDSVPNWLDDDSDGDGVSDAAEAFGNGDANGDGTPDYLDAVNAPADSDGDGIPDEVECAGDVADCPDTDGDNSADHLDDDDDGDGIPTPDERPDSMDADTDDDGIPNHLDDDDDGDGIPTRAERPDDSDIDSDSDSIFDHLDDDDDDDNIPTLWERPNGEDIDSDEDGIPDYLDDDDDDDGVPTRDERNGDEAMDTDDDGIPDHLDDDDDGDGVLTQDELNQGAPLDTDEDGIPNHRDADDDGDGIPTPFERPDGRDVDTDEDGIPDYLDDDDDGDGIPTAAEDPRYGTDSDADGVPDYLDDDDDGDGIPTADERPGGESVDSDADGVPDYLDPFDDFIPDGGVAPPEDEPTLDSGVPDDMGTDMGGSTSDDGGPRVVVPTFGDAGRDLAPDEGVIIAGELRGGGLSCGLAAGSDRSTPLLGLVLLLGLCAARRRRAHRRTKPCAAGIGLAVLLVSSLSRVQSARAQESEPGFALNRYEPAPRGSDWLAADSSSFRGHLSLALGGVWEASLKPLVAYDDDGNELGSIIESQIYTHAGGNITLWNLLRLGASVPVRWFSDGTPQAINGIQYQARQGLAFGDVRLEADFRFLGDAEAPLRLSVGALGFVPSGSQDSYSGDGAFRAMPRLTLAGDVDAIAYSAQLGGLYRFSDDEFDGSEPGLEATIVGAVGYRLLDRRLLLGAEFWSATPLSGDGGILRRTPLELALGAHYTEGEWRLGAGFGPGLGTAPGTPQFRFMATLSWMIDALTEGPPPQDGDGDGILDRDDACADVPGRSHVDPAQNGCPRDAHDSDAN